jgi:hypothetical protein
MEIRQKESVVENWTLVVRLPETYGHRSYNKFEVGITNPNLKKGGFIVHFMEGTGMP